MITRVTKLMIITDIQSQLHQTKRRFTDFVFERVRVGGDGANDSVGTSALAGHAAKQGIRSPRSVSFNLPTASGPARGNAGGVPLVRATSPGAEFREERQRAAARREAEDKLKNALTSTTPGPAPGISGHHAKKGSSASRVSPPSSGRVTPTSSPGRAPTVRKFQISRSHIPTGVLKAAGGGVQKKRGDGAPVRAVIVEKLTREPHSRKASMIENLAQGTGDATVEVKPQRTSVASEDKVQQPPASTRKRPIINQAEKRWREQQKASISAAKQHLTELLDKEAKNRPDDWEDRTERLARELEQFALDLEKEEDMQASQQKQEPVSSPVRSAVPKPPLKYRPRTPNRPRGVTPDVESRDGQTAQQQTKPPNRVQDAMHVEPSKKVPGTPAKEAQQDEEDDSDGDYVYDIYVRRPLPPGTTLMNPLVDAEMDSEAWFRQNGIDTTRRDIGVLVITQEDEEYWETFAEDENEEDQWDPEDEDSNGE